MSRVFPTLLLGFVLGLVACSHVAESRKAAASTSWAHEGSDLKPDPAVVWGRLENGLRYAILPNTTPAQRASLLLLVQVGSLHERDRELGYAHFVEHMAFRELRDFPEGIFTTVERLGGGADARTSPFETRYSIDQLPMENVETLGTSLRVLRAVADGVLFNSTAIERERGVIFSELLTRNATMAHARPDELEFLPPDNSDLRWAEICAVFKGTRLPQRNAIGTDETLRAANAAKLRAFYERWYRPERMILAIAGDFTPATVEPLVRQTFSSLQARGRPPAEMAVEASKRTGIYVNIEVSDEEPAMLLSLGSSLPRAVPDTIERRRQLLVRRTALAMLGRRFERVANAPDAPFTEASTALCHNVPGWELSLLRATAPPALWTKAIAALDYETRRAVEQGFAATELQRATKAETIRTAAAARQAGQRSSADLALALAFAADRGVVFTSADDDRDLTAAQLATIDEAQCQAALREMYPAERLALAFTGPFPEGVPAFEVVGQALDQSRTATLTPFVPPPPLRPFPFTNFGPAGRVVKTEHSALLDADLVEFANGVRLNFKRTHFEPGHLRMMVRVDGGRLACPPDKPGLDLRIGGWLYGGLRDLTPEEESAALLELTGVDYGVSAGEFHVNGHEPAFNLTLWLQAVAARFVRPAFREEGQRRGLEITRGIIASYASTASGVAAQTMFLRMAGGHPAQRLATIDDASQRSSEEFKAWLMQQLDTAPLDIAIIGDIDSTEAIEAVARTFGALPGRNTSDPFAEQRRVSFPPERFSETIDFNGKKGVAAVVLAWPVLGVETYAARFQAEIVAKILEQRLWQRLRSEMGEGYAFSASFAADNVFRPALAVLQARAEVAPDRPEQVAAAIREVAETLARDGATAAEFERAIQPLSHDMESSLSNNEWWLDVLAAAQSSPAYAEGWARALEHYRAVTLEEINAMARTALSNERRCQLIVRPRI